MEKLTIEQLKELLEFHYEYDDRAYEALMTYEVSIDD